VSLCNGYVSNSCSGCSGPSTVTGVNWLPVGGYGTGPGGTGTPPTYVCPSGLTIGGPVNLYQNDVYPIYYNHQTNGLAKGNYGACFGNNTLYMPAGTTTTFADSAYPTAQWGPQDVLGAFTIADITKLSGTTPVASNSATLNGNWKIASRSGVPLALVRDGLTTTMMAAEIMAYDSIVDGRGAWVWPGMGGSIFTAFGGPNSSGSDTIPACDTTITSPGPACVGGGNISDFASARSQHPGGVNVVMCDGSNHFIADSIDINVWRAYATRSAAGIGASGVKESPVQAPD